MNNGSDYGGDDCREGPLAVAEKDECIRLHEPELERKDTEPPAVRLVHLEEESNRVKFIVRGSKVERFPDRVSFRRDAFPVCGRAAIKVRAKQAVVARRLCDLFTKRSHNHSIGTKIG